jgi:hypothetical protein
MQCKKLLTIDKACEHQGMPYCKTDHQTLFGTVGYSLDGTVVTRATVTATGAAL